MDVLNPTILSIQKSANLLCLQALTGVTEGRAAKVSAIRPKLLSKFDSWTISLDPNIDRGYGKRAGDSFATTNYSTQSSQFNWSFFNREAVDPSAAAIFAHEFRHLMGENNSLYRPGDGLRDPKKTPIEMDADAWANKFWSEQCDCK